MATTMRLIAKNVLGSNAATVTFSGIPGTYTDLALVSSVRTDRALEVDGVLIEFNGSSTGYSSRFIEGRGGSGISNGTATTNAGAVASGSTATSNTFGNALLYIPNYAGSTNKSSTLDAVAEHNGSFALIFPCANLWSNTAAITSILLKPSVGTNFVSGSSFFLYGITKA